MNKLETRKHIISLRSAIPEEIRARNSTLIYEKLTSLDVFTHSKTIASFVDFRDEISMDQINRKILSCGKTLILPYISMKDKSMTFYIVEDYSTLITSSFGIKEPNPIVHLKANVNLIDCVLTPGVCFDLKGFRIGYGGGFYDRFFSTLPNHITKIGLAFEIQVIDECFIEPQDQSIDCLLTESKLRLFKA